MNRWIIILTAMAAGLGCISLIWSEEVAAQTFIPGRIEERHRVTRVTRPILSPAAASRGGKEVSPSSPPGTSAIGDQKRASPDGRQRPTDDKARAGLFSIDVDDFLLNLKADKPKGARLPDRSPEESRSEEDSSRELVIAWESWHQKVSEAIYRRWASLGTIPGEARVKITVAKDGALSWEVDDFHSPEFELGAEQAFAYSVRRTLSALERDPILDFPEKSQRKEVTLNTRFAAQMDIGASGYTWKRGDYEKVSEPGH